MRGFSRIVVLLILAMPGFSFAGAVPQEPENDNREFLLDVVTNGYSRWWREVWDAGDNRFRTRLGSNDVSKWSVEEELKLAAGLHQRLRFRFHHARLLRYTTEKISWDVLEFEGRVHKEFYASIYARPAFDKKDGALGLMLQHRIAVNRFVILSVEWPGFMANFAEHHREASDSLLSVYTDSPVRFALDLRERIIPNLWVRARGEVIPQFVMGEEINATGQQIPKERAEAEAIEGWIEYIIDPSREVRDQKTFGIDAAYQRSRKSKDVECGCSWWGDRFVGSTESRTGGETPWAIPQEEFDDDLYERTDDDTVTAWRDTRAFLAPYAWVPVSDRVTLRAVFRYETREIGIANDLDQTFYTTNEYMVPLIGVSYAMGARRQYLLETGWVFEHRTRTEERVDGPSLRITLSDEDYDDHRLYLAFDYVFGESSMIRLNESFELDAEDRGQFGIHDHGFFQLIVGF